MVEVSGKEASLKIKPLEWTKTTSYFEGYKKPGCRSYPEEYEILYSAETTFGTFTVRLLSQWDDDDQCFYSSVVYSYCFDEYRDEGCYTCASLLQGKRLLEKMWQERLMKCLEED
jgi:hypothetical protein